MDNDHDAIVEKFCSSPRPRFQIRNEDGVLHHSLAGDDVGIQSSVDLAMAFVQRSLRLRGVSAINNTPVKRIACDLFLHPDVTPRIEPLLEIYDTTVKGVARFRDPIRAMDRLDLKAGIDFLGRGASKFRCSDVPRYVEMIEHVCEKMNWDASTFLGYRCAIDYPVYGSQIIMMFDPPPASERPT